MARTASCDFLEVYKLMDMDVHDLLLNFWAFNERSLRLTREDANGGTADGWPSGHWHYHHIGSDDGVKA